jgi:hydrocephalus-inducing protein
MNDDFRPQEKLSKKGGIKKGRSGGQQQPKAPKELGDSGSPVFQLHPVRMELYPGQEIDVILEGYSATPRVRGQHIYQIFFS